MELKTQLFWLFIGAIPIACIAWTVINEEIFKEPREFCIKKSNIAKSILTRKLFYLFTCEYCFSHYVTVLFICFTGYKLLLPDWRGYIISGFSLVWMANVYMSMFAFIRQGIKKERVVIKDIEHKIKKKVKVPKLIDKV